MNIAKALKEKNRLALEIKDLMTLVQKHNSYRVDNASKQKYNVKDLVSKVAAKIDDLVELKVKIHAASAPVRDKIFALSETKTFINNLGSIDTAEGMKDNDGGWRGTGTTDIEYAVHMDELFVKELITKYKGNVDTLQEELEAFNYTTEI